MRGRRRMRIKQLHGAGYKLSEQRESSGLVTHHRLTVEKNGEQSVIEGTSRPKSFLKVQRSIFNQKKM